MAEYTLTVTTGSMLNAGTLDNVYVTLIGSERETEQTLLSPFGLDDKHAKVSKTKINVAVHTCSCLVLILWFLNIFFWSPLDGSTKLPPQGTVF